MFTTSIPLARERWLDMTAAVERGPWRSSNLLFIDEDYTGSFFIWFDEYGPRCLTRARGWHNAWEATVDELPTIDEDQVTDAYGLYVIPWNEQWAICSDHDEHGEEMFSPHHRATHRVVELVSRDTNERRRDHEARARARATDLIGILALELVEGYEYQSNVSGTGIVAVGHHAQLCALEEWNEQYPDRTVVPVFSLA